MKNPKKLIVGDVYKVLSVLNVTKSDPEDPCGLAADIVSFPVNTVYMYLGKTKLTVKKNMFPGLYSKILVEGAIYFTYNPWRLETMSQKI